MKVLEAWTNNPKDLVDLDYIMHDYVYEEIIKALNAFK